MQYKIKGVEEVFDAFDNFEHSNPISPITVNANSLEDALKKGKEIIQKIICTKRFESGFIKSKNSYSGSSGMYLASIEEVTDSQGRVLYENYIKRTF